MFTRALSLTSSIMNMAMGSGGGSQKVWVKLTEDKTGLEWATLEQKAGKPVDSSTIPLVEIKAMTKKDKAIVVRDGADTVLLEISASSAEEQEKFRIALAEALEVLMPELDGRQEKNEARKRRLEELEAKRAEGQRKKEALGPVGMTATAKIMMGQK